MSFRTSKLYVDITTLDVPKILQPSVQGWQPRILGTSASQQNADHRSFRSSN